MPRYGQLETEAEVVHSAWTSHFESVSKELDHTIHTSTTTNDHVIIDVK